MPSRPGRLCPRCNGRVASGTECPTCRPPWQRSTSGHWSTGSTRRWRRERGQYLAEHPWCARADCPRLAEELDHVDPDHPDRWDRGNWQGLCTDHHREKTAADAAARASSASSSSPAPG